MWTTCGLLWCFYQLFGDRSLILRDSHSDGTHSLQRIIWWASDAKSPNVFRWKNKLIYILGGLRMSKFSANFHFWVNYSLNSANLWFKARWNKTDKCEKHCAQLNSQKAFQFTNCHHLPWIYCSNTNCTIVFWQKCGIFIPKLYYIINVDVLNVLKE